MDILKCVIVTICIFQQAFLCSSKRGKKHYDLIHSKRLFKNFILQYDKNYETSDEYNRRFEYFKQNLKRINKENMESTSVEFGITSFADLSEEELRKTVSSHIRSDPNMKKPAARRILRVGEGIPDSWDWREHDAVTRVINQGPCGACWAFSAIGLIEGRFAIKNKDLVPFSYQQLLDCTGESNNCEGGRPDASLNFVAAEFGGLVSQGNYPYAGRKQNNCTVKISKVEAKIKIAEMVEVPCEEHLKLLVYKYGPMSAGMQTGLGFVSYREGIAYPSDIGCAAGRPITHTITIVGYGVDKNDTQYWIIKNSYGRTWGERGYLRLIRGVNACGITEYVIDATLE